MSSWSSGKLRALAIVAGCTLALVSSLAGVDGMCHALGGALVGFGIGKGSDVLTRRLSSLD